MTTSIMEDLSNENWHAVLVDLESEYEYRETLTDQVQEQYTQEEWDAMLLEQEIAQTEIELGDEALMRDICNFNLYYDTFAELAVGIKTIQNFREWCQVLFEEFDHIEHKEVVGEWYEGSRFVVDVHYEIRHLTIKMKGGGRFFMLHLNTTPDVFASLQDIFPTKNDNAYHPITEVLSVLATMERRQLIDEVLADLE